jgi:hypothetical protein
VLINTGRSVLSGSRRVNSEAHAETESRDGMKTAALEKRSGQSTWASHDGGLVRRVSGSGLVRVALGAGSGSRPIDRDFNSGRKPTSSSHRLLRPSKLGNESLARPREGSPGWAFYTGPGT